MNWESPPGRNREGAVLLAFPVERVAVPDCRRHRFRWSGEDAFSGSSLYACRCGVVRPAM